MNKLDRYLLFQIAKKLHLIDILNLCQTNKEINRKLECSIWNYKLETFSSHGSPELETYKLEEFSNHEVPLVEPYKLETFSSHGSPELETYKLEEFSNHEVPQVE